MRALGAENAGELAEFLADHIDFSAVCENNGAARSLVERARVSYDSDAAARLEAFYKSCAFRAAREFQSFFTENFYGACFTGVYGQSGYEDISAKLSELAERYGLQYASDKTKEENKVIYDNGCVLRGTAPAGGSGQRKMARTLHPQERPVHPHDALHGFCRVSESVELRNGIGAEHCVRDGRAGEGQRKLPLL